MRRVVSIATGLLLAVLACGPLAWAGDDNLEIFFGVYVGRTISEKDRGREERDIAITVTPGKKKGFVLEWTTIIPRADGSTSEKTRKINFQASTREHIYSAGEKPKRDRSGPAN